MTPKQFEAYLRERAAAYGVDPELAAGIWRAETGGRMGNVVGDAGRSVGPWQILDTTSKQLGLSLADRADPVRSTEAIMPLIRRLSDKAQGDFALARLGYMRGEAAMNNPSKYANHKIAGNQMQQFAAYQAHVNAQRLGLTGAPEAGMPPAVQQIAASAQDFSAQPTIDAAPIDVPDPEATAAMFDVLGLGSDQWQTNSTITPDELYPG